MTTIQWTEETWNPVIGCTPVSSGCLNCYAATMARRLEKMNPKDYGPRDGIRIAEVRNGRAVFTGEVRCLEDRLTIPLKRRKPTMYFVNSMSDLFHEAVPFEFIDRVFAVMALCPQHTFQVLTKRPERMAEYLNTEDRFDCNIYETALDRAPGNISERTEYCEEHVQKWPLPNVWLGTSVEDQKAADERIPHLLRCPAAVRFLSCEPLLGEVELCIPEGCRRCNHPGNVFPREHCPRCGGSGQEPSIDWIIVGGESGPKARPCDVAHIRSIVQQCKDAGVPCFVKQLGKATCIRVKDYGDTVTYQRGGGFWPDTACGRANDWICRMTDPKGGDPAEWPERLRVREMPERPA